MGKVKHFQKGSDFQLLRLGLYNVAFMATISWEDNYPASVFDSEIRGDHGVKKPHICHQSPVATGAASARSRRAGAGTRTGAGAFGTKARTVPISMIQTPIQIHITSAFRWALRMGWPLSGFSPSNTRYKSSFRLERISGMVEVCWLA